MTDKKFEFTGFEQIGGYRVPRYKDLMKDYKMAGYADEASDEELLKALEKYRIRKHELMCECMSGGKSYEESVEICSRQGYDEKIFQIDCELNRRESPSNLELMEVLIEARDFLKSKDISLRCVEEAIKKHGASH